MNIRDNVSFESPTALINNLIYKISNDNDSSEFFSSRHSRYKSKKKYYKLKAVIYSILLSYRKDYNRTSTDYLSEVEELNWIIYLLRKNNKLDSAVSVIRCCSFLKEQGYFKENSDFYSILRFILSLNKLKLQGNVKKEACFQPRLFYNLKELNIFLSLPLSYGASFGHNVGGFHYMQYPSLLFHMENFDTHDIYHQKKIIGNIRFSFLNCIQKDKKYYNNAMGALVQSTKSMHPDIHLNIPDLPERPKDYACFSSIQSFQPYKKQCTEHDEGYESPTDNTCDAYHGTDLWNEVFDGSPLPKLKSWECQKWQCAKVYKPYLSESGPDATLRLWLIYQQLWNCLDKSVCTQFAYKSEADLCAAIVFVMIGVESQTFIWSEEKLFFGVAKGLCCSGVAPDSLQNLLQPFAEIGTFYQRLQDLSNYVIPSSWNNILYGVVTKAFISSLMDILHYYRYLEKWLYEGYCCDPEGEFVVQVNYEFIQKRDRSYWLHGYVYKNGSGGSVHLEKILGKAYSCGKSINLLKLCNPKITLRQKEMTRLEEQKIQMQISSMQYKKTVEKILDHLSALKEEAVKRKRVEFIIRKQDMETAARHKDKKALEESEYDKKILMEQHAIEDKILMNEKHQREIRERDYEKIYTLLEEREKAAKEMIEKINFSKNTKATDLPTKKENLDGNRSNTEFNSSFSTTLLKFDMNEKANISSDIEKFEHRESLCMSIIPNEISGADSEFCKKEIETPEASDLICGTWKALTAAAEEAIINRNKNLLSAIDFSGEDQPQNNFVKLKGTEEAQSLRRKICLEEFGIDFKLPDDNAKIRPVSENEILTDSMKETVTSNINANQSDIEITTSFTGNEVNLQSLDNPCSGVVNGVINANVVKEVLNKLEQPIINSLISNQNAKSHGEDNCKDILLIELHEKHLTHYSCLSSWDKAKPVLIDQVGGEILKERGRNIHGHASDSVMPEALYRGSKEFELEPEDIFDKKCEQVFLNSDATLENINLPNNVVPEFQFYENHIFSENPIKNHFGLTFKGDCYEENFEKGKAHTLNSIPVYFQNSLSVLISTQNQIVNQCLLNYLLVEESLLDHFLALRSYLLLCDVNFARGLANNLFSKCGPSSCPSKVLNPVELNNVINKAFFESSNRSCPLTDNLSFVILQVPPSFNHVSTILDCVELHYTVGWPHCLILDDSVLCTYSKVWKFLSSLQYVVYCGDDAFRYMFSFTHYPTINGIDSSWQFHKLSIYRHEIHHFLCVMQAYITNQILQLSWNNFQHDLKKVVSFDDLYDLHVSFVNSVTARCFLVKESQPLLKLLQEMFIHCLTFKTVLTAHSFYYNSDSKVYEHPAYETLEKTYLEFSKMLNFFKGLLEKAENIGSIEYIQELSTRLDFSNYFKAMKLEHHVGVSSESVFSPAGNISADSLGNDSTVESIWAIKAMEHTEVHFNLLCAVDPKFLRLSPKDDLIYGEFRKEFPNFCTKKLVEDDLKSPPAKEKWRQFCNKFEHEVKDFNFATLVRIDAEEEYSEANTILVTRIQFFCIEVARNREGLNDSIRLKFAPQKTKS